MTAWDIAKKSGSKRIVQILELQQSLRPDAAAYYVNRDAHISIVDGQNQAGVYNSALNRPLTVRVTDADGKPMANAPVKFEVEGGFGELLVSPLNPESGSLVLRSNLEGVCAVYFDPPDRAGSESLIKATVGQPGAGRDVVFNELIVEDNGQRIDNPFQVRNCVGSPEGNDYDTLTWQNQSLDATFIGVLKQNPDKSWRILYTLPPDATTTRMSMQREFGD
jgi:hypothetical protein